MPTQSEIAQKRLDMILPLLDPSLAFDAEKKSALRKKVAEENGVSERSIMRYEKAYAAQSFEGLKPKHRSKSPSKGRPDNWDKVLDEACALKKEVPSRPAQRIIWILEKEKKVDAGILKKHTLNRHFKKMGITTHDLTEKENETPDMATRYCKPNRMMLLQGDIKYGPLLPIGKNGAMRKTYLSSLLDDHSRKPLHSEFYASQVKEIVEETVRQAIMKHGKPDLLLFDNGGQYVSDSLRDACNRLGIPIQHCKVLHAYTKGTIEKFHYHVSTFMKEFELEADQTLENLNREWQAYLKNYYLVEPHSGIEEYYRQNGLEVPPGGISPKMEWDRDERPLQPIPEEQIRDAFLHTSTRIVRSDGCISLFGLKYYVSKSFGWKGKKVEARYPFSIKHEAPLSVTCTNPDGNTVEAKMLEIRGDIDYEAYAEEEEAAKGRRAEREAQAKQNAARGSRFLRILEMEEEGEEPAGDNNTEQCLSPMVAPESAEEPAKPQGAARLSYADYTNDDDE